MRVECIYWPQERERMLFKRAVRITMGKAEEPHELPTPKLVRDCLTATCSRCAVRVQLAQ